MAASGLTLVVTTCPQQQEEEEEDIAHVMYNNGARSEGCDNREESVPVRLSVQINGVLRDCCFNDKTNKLFKLRNSYSVRNCL